MHGRGTRKEAKGIKGREGVNSVSMNRDGGVVREKVSGGKVGASEKIGSGRRM